MGGTVKVSNISSKATIQEIEDFFSFSGQIENINLNSDGEDSQIAYVTFKDKDSLKFALLLSGSAILDKEVNISALSKLGTEELALEPGDDSIEAGRIQSRPGAINRAQEIVRAMLSKGFTVGKDAMRRASSLDKKSEKAMDKDALRSMNESLDQKSKEVNAGEVEGTSDGNNNGEAKGSANDGKDKSIACDDKSGANGDNDKDSSYDEGVPQDLLGGKQNKGGNNNVRVSMQKCYKHVCAVNEKLQLGQRTMSALATAQQGVASAGSAVASNKFVAAGGMWVSGALSRVTLKGSSNTPSHLNNDGERSPSSQHHEHVQLTEMTSFSSHKSEQD
eukprot:c20431_g1_i1 orf=22-1023(-)